MADIVFGFTGENSKNYLVGKPNDGWFVLLP